MKKLNKFIQLVLLVSLTLAGVSATADTILLSDNQPITGKIIQTNGDDVLILTPFEAFDYPSR